MDLSSGIDPSLENALASPPDVYRFAENYMFVGYDPKADLGIYLHLGTCPDDFSLWEDQVYLALPGDEGVIAVCSYHRTPVAERPGGACLRARCLEPFRRWHLSFVGRGVRSSNQEMLARRLADGPKELFSFDLEVECLTPAWDAQHSVKSGGANAGSMDGQVWAKTHYQQMFRIHGTVRWPGREVTIDTTGTRDHSRGQRGHAYDRYGGHNLYSIHFPSGRAFQLMQMWTPDGKISLNTGYAVLDGKLHYGEGIDASRLEAVKPPGESVHASLRTAKGEHALRGEVVKTLLMTLEMPYGTSYGADTTAGRGTYSPSFGRWEWDSEIGYGFTERTNRLGAQVRT